VPEPYSPNFDAAQVERLRHWHEAAYDELRAAGRRTVSYLGLDLVVPPDVFAPTPVSDLLGRAVLDEVREGDRVLDMGTGSGVNAILAATCAREVVGVDINPHAVAAAIDNARRNGVAANTTFVEGDLFDAVDGMFDLIVYDPPFRWFRPRDLLEVAMADEGYRSLGRLMNEVPSRLTPGGRVLLFFGTSGDMQHLTELVDRAGFGRATVAERDLTKDGLTVTYVTFRLTRPHLSENGRPLPQGRP
jgi:release factor glutamine methyltransferase